MKAMIYTQPGATAVLREDETDKPTPSARQVLIKVAASSLNIGDYNRFASFTAHGKISLGTRLMDRMTGAIGQPLGGEIAGIVETVGPDVKNFSKGDKVFAPTLTGMIGGWAQFALADAVSVCRKPANLSFEEAAVIPVGGITAMGAVKKADIRAGQDVLVYGASGGVGQFALQFAVATGANVTAVCSTRNVDVASTMGAARVIDYKRDDFTKTGPYDAIIAVNGYNPLNVYKHLLKPHGTYVAIGGTKQAMMSLLGPLAALGSGKTLGSTLYASNVKERYMPEIAELAKQGKVKPYVERVCSIHDVRQAIDEVVANHASGKTAVTMDF